MIDKQRIKAVIDIWDPIELFPFCPSDEYSIEIDEIFFIATQKNATFEELGIILFNVFKKYFGSSFTKSKSDCIRIAEKIMTTC